MATALDRLADKRTRQELEHVVIVQAALFRLARTLALVERSRPTRLIAILRKTARLRAARWSRTAVVLPEGDVEHPVQRILNSPVLADGPTEHSWIVTTARQEGADLGFDLGSAFGTAASRRQERCAGWAIRLGSQDWPPRAGEYPSTNQAAMCFVERVASVSSV